MIDDTMVSFATPVYCPPPPETIEATGLPQSLIDDLVLRRTYVAGVSTLQSLGQALKLSPLIVEVIFRELRQQLFIEVKGMVGNDYSFTLTEKGAAWRWTGFRSAIMRARRRCR